MPRMRPRATELPSYFWRWIEATQPLRIIDTEDGGHEVVCEGYACDWKDRNAYPDHMETYLAHAQGVHQMFRGITKAWGMSGIGYLYWKCSIRGCGTGAGPGSGYAFTRIDAIQRLIDHQRADHLELAPVEWLPDDLSLMTRKAKDASPPQQGYETLQPHPETVLRCATMFFEGRVARFCPNPAVGFVDEGQLIPQCANHLVGKMYAVRVTQRMMDLLESKESE